MAALIRWQPYNETVALSDVMDRMLNRAFVRPFSAFDMASYWDGTRPMPIDVIEDKDGYTVKASVPGIKPEELDINIENNVVTIRAERKAEDGESRKDEDTVRWQERYYGKLERCFTLPVEVNADKVKAELEHGVLKLSLPKAETVKPKTIQVKVK
jgi:HSP20 family protein